MGSHEVITVVTAMAMSFAGSYVGVRVHVAVMESRLAQAEREIAYHRAMLHWINNTIAGTIAVVESATGKSVPIKDPPEPPR